MQNYNGLVSTNSYNLDNTLASKNVASKADLSYTYGYDVNPATKLLSRSIFSSWVNKNVTSKTNTGTVMSGYSWTTNFDNIDRVTSWNTSGSAGVLPASQSWTLDKIGNWNNTSGSFNGTFEKTYDVVVKIKADEPSALPASILFFHSDRQFNVRGLTNLSGKGKWYRAKAYLGAVDDFFKSNDQFLIEFLN